MALLEKERQLLDKIMCLKTIGKTPLYPEYSVQTDTHVGHICSVVLSLTPVVFEQPRLLFGEDFPLKAASELQMHVALFDKETGDYTKGELVFSAVISPMALMAAVFYSCNTTGIQPITVQQAFGNVYPAPLPNDRTRRLYSAEHVVKSMMSNVNGIQTSADELRAMAASKKSFPKKNSLDVLASLQMVKQCSSNAVVGFVRSMENFGLFLHKQKHQATQIIRTTRDHMAMNAMLGQSEKPLLEAQSRAQRDFCLYTHIATGQYTAEERALIISLFEEKLDEVEAYAPNLKDSLSSLATSALNKHVTDNLDAHYPSHASLELSTSTYMGDLFDISKTRPGSVKSLERKFVNMTIRTAVMKYSDVDEYSVRTTEGNQLLDLTMGFEELSALLQGGGSIHGVLARLNCIGGVDIPYSNIDNPLNSIVRSVSADVKSKVAPFIHAASELEACFTGLSTNISDPEWFKKTMDTLDKLLSELPALEKELKAYLNDVSPAMMEVVQKELFNTIESATQGLPDYVKEQLKISVKNK